MKHIKRVLAMILALVMLLTPMVSVSAANTDSSKDELIVFDLEAFLQTLNTDVEKYDFLKFATALQGLVNRDEPQLYFLFSTNYAASTQGYDMDEYWLEKITSDDRGYGELKDGRDLADFKIVKSMSFWNIVEKFSDYYNGLVVWESDVPASANVASTIAGVEDLLPVRYAPGGNNLYAQLMKHGFTVDDIKRDLTGLFTGEGFIPTLGSSIPGAKIEYTTTPSTKSIKADPYLWAKMFYLDTGLTNPLSLTFSLDAGGDKIRQKAERAISGEDPRMAARIVSAFIPKNMAPGEVSPVKLTFENIGTETWDDAYIRAGIPSGQFRVYNDEECKTMVTSYFDRFPSVYCEPGDQATYFGYLKAPSVEGSYRISFYMVEDGLPGSGNAGVFTEHFVNINVSSNYGNASSDALDPYLPSVIAENETPANDAEIIKVGLADAVEPSEDVSAEVVIKNVGLEDFAAGACKIEYTIGGSTNTISVPQTAAGDTASVTISFKAPSAVGSSDVTVRAMLGDETLGEPYNTTLYVGDKASAGGKLNAQIVSVEYAKNLVAGGKNRITVEAINTGSEAWELAENGIKLAETTGKRYLSDLGDSDDDGKLESAIAIEDNVVVEPGEHYFFAFELHSYANNGEGKDYAKPGDIIKMNLQLVSEAGNNQGALADAIAVSYIIDEACDTDVIKYADDAEMTDVDYDATILSVAIPTRMEPGEVAPIRVSVKNTGTEAWADKWGDPCYIRLGTGSHAFFKLCTDLAGVNGDASDRSRIALTPGLMVEPGTTYTYKAYLKAPSVDELGDPITYQEFERVDFSAIGDWLVRDQKKKNLDTIFVPIIVAEPGVNAPVSMNLMEVADEEVIMLEDEPLFEVVSNGDTYTFNDPSKVASVSGAAATLISAEIPTKVKPGEKFDISVTLLNNGDYILSSWLTGMTSTRYTTIKFGGAVNYGSKTTDRDVDTTTYGYPVIKDGFYVICDATNDAYEADLEGKADAAGHPNAKAADGIIYTNANPAALGDHRYLYGQVGGVKVPGICGSSEVYDTLNLPHTRTHFNGNESYTFTGQMVAPSTPGEYDITLKAFCPANNTARTGDETITITVEGEEEASSSHTFNDPASVEYGKVDYAATLISAEIPTKVQPGEKFDVSVVAVNNGKEAQASWLTSFGAQRYTTLVFGGDVGYSKSSDTVDTKNFDQPVIKNKFYPICDATKAAYDADQAGKMDKAGGGGTAADGIYTIDANNARYLFGEVGGVKIPGISGSSAGYTTMNISHVNNGSQPGLFDYKASYTFTGQLVAPYTPGEYEITLKLYCPGNGSTRTSVETVKITVEGEAPEEEKNPNEHIFKDPSEVQNVSGYAATLLSAEVPVMVNAGEKFPVKFTMINNGNETLATWMSAVNSSRYTTLVLGDAVNYKPGDAAKDSYDPPAAVNSFYAICDATKAAYDADQAGTLDIKDRGGNPVAGDGIMTIDANNRLYLYGNVGNTAVPGIAGSSQMFNTLNISHTSPLVNAGETYTFTGYLVAPTTSGEYTISAKLYAPGSKTDRTEAEEIKITVLAEEEVFKTDDQAPVTGSSMNAAIMSASVPERMRIDTTFPITVTVKNTGTTDWAAEKVWLGNADGLFRLTDATGEAGCNAEMNRIDIAEVETVKSGETYTFTYWLKAPETEGTQSLTVQMVNDGTAFGEAKSIDVFVTSAVSNFVPEEPADATPKRDAEFVKIGMPSEPAVVDSEVTASVHVKNTGVETWTATTDGEAGYYLCYRIGSGTPTYLPVTEDIAQGESAGFTVTFDAPDREKSFTVRVKMVYRNERGFSTSIGDEILLRGESVIDMGDRNAEIVSMKLYDMNGNEILDPWTILEGDKAQVAIEVLNTGATTWDADSEISLTLTKEKHPTVFSTSGAKDDEKPLRAIGLEPGITVKHGERYVFCFDLHTWTMHGNDREFFMPGTTTDLQLRLHADGDDAGYFGPMIDLSYGIEMIVGSSEVLNADNSDLFMDEEDCRLTGQMHHVTYISAKVPSEASIGQIAPFEITVMNTGTITWREGVNSLDGVRLAVWNAGFGFYMDEDATMGWGSDRNRIHIDQNVLINGQKPATVAEAVVKPGDTVTFSGYIKVPNNPASYVLEIGMVNDAIDGPIGFSELTDLRLKLNVDVIGRSEVEEEDIAVSDLTYGDLLHTSLGNADYYIANKAFFWDLSVEKEIAPLDDRSQPVGTDVKVLRQILDSQRKRAQAYEEGTDPWNKTPGVGEGYGIFICEGFTPWFLKYSNHNDPNSPHVSYRSEWLNVQLISEYGGMIDADAYGTVTVCNCSIFSKIKLKVEEYKEKNKNLRQMQDDFNPMVGDPSVVYDPDTIYICYHMGDWDGSAWISGILPTIWETDPRRGEIPVAWPLASALSERIPHVYNWMYDTAKPNDYFVAGDNGVGYFNANFLADPLTAESGITKEIGAELIDDLVKYNTEYHELFGLDIYTFIISGSYEGGKHYAGIHDDIIKLYDKLSPLGSTHSPNAAGYITEHDGIKTPYVPINIGTDGLETEEKREAAAELLINNIKQRGQFQYERTVKARVTELLQVLNLVKVKRPDLNIMPVDPYTFMRLFRESNGGTKPEAEQKVVYEAPKATAVKIDGVVDGGEWNKAAVMTLSPESVEVLKHGRNWNAASLATAQDMTSKMRVMWDNNYLYVLDERTDNDHMISTNNTGMDWVADASAIFLDTDDKDNENNFYAGDFAVLFNDAGAGKTQVWMRRGSDNTVRTERALASSEYIAAVKTDSTGGYVYEIAIPWSTLGNYKPVAGNTIGMTTLAIDGDADASGGGRQIMWHGSGDPQLNWAVMKFAN